MCRCSDRLHREIIDHHTRPQKLGTPSLVVKDFFCLSGFALCAYANCSINFVSDPPIAECGCADVPPEKVELTWHDALYLSLAAPSCAPPCVIQLPAGYPFNTGTSSTILDASVKAANLKACAVGGGKKCIKPSNYNIAPICKEMSVSLRAKGGINTS